MGDRSYIVVESEHFAAPLIFYGHWSGEDASAAVTNVLSWTDRIGDPNYLAAQIFYEFAVKLGSYDGRLSFGIEAQNLYGGYFDWADYPVVYVNADKGTYSIGGDDWFDRWGEPLG